MIDQGDDVSRRGSLDVLSERVEEVKSRIYSGRNTPVKSDENNFNVKHYG